MKKIVVIGGGFAGSLAAKKLEKDFEVTLIDTKDYFEFTPAILRTIVEPGYIKKIHVLHSEYLKRARILIGEVGKIDDNNVYIKKTVVPFDYLVICSGSRYESPFKDLNNLVERRTELLIRNNELLKKSKRITIVGGGLVGIELAGEILDRFNDKDLTIIHSGEKLIERNSERAINYAENYLKKKGVKIIYEEKVKKITKNNCLTEKGKVIKGDLVFICIGVKPNYEFLKEFDGALNEKNQVIVNGFLQVPGRKNIFAAGDITSIIEEKTAQNAQRQAKSVVENILALESGKEMIRFISKKTPMVISLGRWKSIYDNGKIVLTGTIPAFMKWAIGVKEMWKKRR